MQPKHYNPNRLSTAGVFITLGIIFGDIGTSPLYVVKAIVGSGVPDPELVLGGMSCVFWTLLITTTFKYIYLALQADNHGEGGIFALYGLLKDHPARWPLIASLIGCSALIADGFITPPISISSAIEGLNVLYPGLPTVPIVVVILIGLFAFQQFGTSVVGRTFGPIMFGWFSLIGSLGLYQIWQYPAVFSALNPVYAFNLLTHHPSGFWVLGAVFLCTTGAEALYADLGHCGKSNIRVSWTFVLTCLLLNYLGQSAWLLNHPAGIQESQSVFYSIVPASWLPAVIILATAAAVIASQALISGCFTLVNEATKLRLWIYHKISYPAHMKGQVYINGINWFLLAGCMTVLVIFEHATNMEAAYGLTITMDMLMTTALLLLYFRTKGVPRWQLAMLGLVFFTTESSFLISNLRKFFYGGWFTFLVALTMFCLLYFFHRARSLRDKHNKLVNLEDFMPMFQALMADESIPKEATNLVFMSKKSRSGMQVDSNVIYSIFQQKPKKADVYWFVHVEILDYPREHEKSYTVKTIIPGKVFFVRLEFGFKVRHNVNRLFKKIVQDMADNGEVDVLTRYQSMRQYNISADFKFVFVKSMVSADNDLKPMNKLAMAIYELLNLLNYPRHKDFGLDTLNVQEEVTPLLFHTIEGLELERKSYE